MHVFHADAASASGLKLDVSSRFHHRRRIVRGQRSVSRLINALEAWRLRTTSSFSGWQIVAE